MPRFGVVRLQRFSNALVQRRGIFGDALDEFRLLEGRPYSKLCRGPRTPEDDVLRLPHFASNQSVAGILIDSISIWTGSDKGGESSLILILILISILVCLTAASIRCCIVSYVVPEFQ